MGVEVNHSPFHVVSAAHSCSGGNSSQTCPAATWHLSHRRQPPRASPSTVDPFFGSQSSQQLTAPMCATPRVTDFFRSSPLLWPWGPPRAVDGIFLHLTSKVHKGSACGRRGMAALACPSCLTDLCMVFSYVPLQTKRAHKTK